MRNDDCAQKRKPQPSFGCWEKNKFSDRKKSTEIKDGKNKSKPRISLGAVYSFSIKKNKINLFLQLSCVFSATKQRYSITWAVRALMVCLVLGVATASPSRSSCSWRDLPLTCLEQAMHVNISPLSKNRREQQLDPEKKITKHGILNSKFLDPFALKGGRRKVQMRVTSGGFGMGWSQVGYQVMNIYYIIYVRESGKWVSARQNECGTLTRLTHSFSPWSLIWD